MQHKTSNCIKRRIYGPHPTPKHVLTLSRQHNDANILSLGAHFLTSEEAGKAVLLWLGTEFSGEERHVRRIQKIDEININ